MSNNQDKIPEEIKNWIEAECPNWARYDSGVSQKTSWENGAVSMYRHLSQQQGPRWVSGKAHRPADGKRDQTIAIKPLRKHHNYDLLPKVYCALIWMGEHDGGAAWHWYEGPNSGWHTKIHPEDWDSIEYLDESPSPATSTQEGGLFEGDGYFRCQREIEMNTPCNTQCDHCREYFKQLDAPKVDREKESQGLPKDWTEAMSAATVTNDRIAILLASEKALVEEILELTRERDDYRKMLFEVGEFLECKDYLAFAEDVSALLRKYPQPSTPTQTDK